MRCASDNDILQLMRLCRTEIAAKADVGVTLTATAVATDWSGDSAPYTQTIDIAGLSGDADAIVGLDDAASAAQRAACRLARLTPTAQADGTLTLTAEGTKPAVDLPIFVRVLH